MMIQAGQFGKEYDSALQMLDDLILPNSDLPVYQRLADALAQRIADGDLTDGDKLPPHREIAKVLGINVTTVTRAILALQQRGLVVARPGRGTEVATKLKVDEANSFKSAPSDESDIVDLSVNRPATTAYLDALAAVTPLLSKDRRFSATQDYHPPEGPVWARAAVADWIAPAVGDADAGRIVITQGAQHGLACVFAAVAQAGDVILADSITYQGINALCRSLNLDLRGIPADREGMRPDAFEAACTSSRPRAVFIVPSMHNPTTVTLSEERRRAIAAIARRHNVLIVEDDVYRPLLEDKIPSFAAIEPELTIYVSCLSKCVCPGLRFGFVLGPRALMGHVAASLRIDCWSVSPLTALVGTIILEDGFSTRIIDAQKAELRQRQKILREALAGFDVQSSETSTHAWLHLPEPWRGSVFARAARQRGVGLLAADAFSVGRETLTHAVRINVSAARSQLDLRRALNTLVEVINSEHFTLPDAM